MNYHFYEARRKGVLTKRDQIKRLKIARDVLNKHSPQLWTDKICFYLDGVSFWYKTNPVAEAKTLHGKKWQQRNKGLNPLCTAKSSHTGSGGKAVKMFVAISYRKGVIFCEQYEKCDRDYFASFIRRNFRKLFRASGKMHSRLFVQDNCPIQNCAKAQQAMKAVGAKLFAFPPRSCDRLAIENVFNLVRRELRLQALCRNLVYQSYEQSSKRARRNEHFSVLLTISSNPCTNTYILLLSTKASV